MSVEEVFDKYAGDYDSKRKLLIPCHDDFYRIALDAIPFSRQRELRVLDLGAGTGYFSTLIADRYPSAQLVLMDVSAEMLRIAEQKFERLNQGRVTFLRADYVHADFQGTYDLVVSSLSLHHLADHEKIAVYRKICRVLEPGGTFVNCDQIRGANTWADKLFHRFWLQQVKDNGVDEKTLAAALERMQEDQPATLADQLHWLAEQGFTDVTSWYQYFGFAVFSGAKPMY